MHVCIYIYIYMCVCVYMYIYIYTKIHTHKPIKPGRKGFVQPPSDVFCQRLWERRVSGLRLWVRGLGLWGFKGLGLVALGLRVLGFRVWGFRV